MNHILRILLPRNAAVLLLAFLSVSCLESELSQWRAEQRAAGASLGEPVEEAPLEVASSDIPSPSTPVVQNPKPQPQRKTSVPAPVVASTEKKAEKPSQPAEEKPALKPAPEPAPAPTPEPANAAARYQGWELKAESGGDGTVALWLVDEKSGDRLSQIMNKTSQGLQGQFSPDGQWIVVTDQAFSELQTVHLFKQVEGPEYRKVERDDFTGTIWDQFSATKVAPHLTVKKWVTEFKGWGEGARSAELRLAALPSQGAWIEDTYTVDLTAF